MSASTPVPVRHRLRSVVSATLAGALIASGALLGSTAAYAEAGDAQAPTAPATEQPVEQTPAAPVETPQTGTPAAEQSGAEAPAAKSAAPAAQTPVAEAQGRPAAAPADAPASLGAVTATVKQASAAGGLVLSVSASDLPDGQVYAGLIERGREADVSSGGGYAAFAQPFPTVAGGQASFELTAPVENLDRAKQYEVLVWKLHSQPDASTILARSDVDLTPAQWNDLIPATPQVTVSQTSGLDPEVTTEVTVRGTGFFPHAPETSGARPPLAGKFTGVYVAFGSYAQAWQPSAGAAAATRSNVDQKWAVPAESMATIGGAAAGAIELKSDGTFETTLRVSKNDAKAIADGSWGVVTYPGGGAKYAPFETLTPVSFAAPTPRVTVSQTTGLDPEATTEVTVRGTGFAPHAPETSGARPPLAGKFTGVYVTFGSYAKVWQPSTGAAASTRAAIDQKWAVPAESMATIGGTAAGAIELTAAGTFETTLRVSKNDAKAIADGTWGVATYPGGGAKYAPFETLTPISFAAPKAAVAPTVQSADANGLAVDVALSKVSLQAADAGVYVALIERGTEASLSSDNMGAAVSYVTRARIVDGAAATTLTAPAAKLDRSKQYEVLVWRAHGNATPDRIIGRGDVAVSDAQWSAVFPSPVSGTAKIASASTEGLTIAASVAGADPAKLPNGVHVGVVKRGTAVGAVQSDFLGATASVVTVPAGGEFSANVVIPAAQLDRSTEYDVVVWPRRTNPTAANIVTVIPVQVTAAEWDQVFPARASATAKVSGATAAGLAVDFSGTGLTAAVAPMGVYVAVVETGTAPGTNSDTTAAYAYVTAQQISEGVLARQLVVPPSRLDRTRAYEAVVWRAHGEATPETTFGRQALTVTDAQWDSVLPAPAPKVTAAVTGATAKGLTLDAAASGLRLQAGDAGVYFALIERGTAGDLTSDNMGVAADYVPTKLIVDGAAKLQLEAPAAKLDRAKQYEVLVWRAHGLPTADRVIGSADVAVTNAQWDAVFPADPAPKASAQVAKADASGLEIAFTGSGFTAKQAPAGVYIAVVEAGSAPKQGEKTTLAAEYVAPQNLGGGSLSKTVSLAKAQLDRTKTYEVVVWRAHGPATPSSTFLREKLAVTEAQWNLVFPTQAATGSLEWGVRAKFREYVTGPIAQGKIDVQKPATQSGGAYKFPQIVGGTWDAKRGTGTIRFSGNVNFSGHGGVLNLNLANPIIDVRDARTALLQVPQNGKTMTIATIDLASAKQSPLAGGALKFANAPVVLTAEGAKTFFQGYLETTSKMDPLTFTAGAASGEKPVTPPVVKPVPKPKPKPQPKPAPTGGSAQLAGSLTWGVSTPFANYVTGSIAKGGISTSGVGGGRGGYVFPQVTGGSWNPKTQTGTVQYSGVITYSGHKGALSESVANPTIRVTSATSGEVLVGGRVFGTLNLAAAQKSVGKHGEVTWSGVPVSGGFSYGSYSLGADPLTFTVGAANGARFGSTSVSGETPKRTAKETAPTKSGITILTPADKIVPGGEIEFEATGFEPGERGILVVMYSKPVVLDENAGANAQGAVRWIGKLPKDLTGTHTITLQGSVDRGAVVQVAQPTALQIADAQVLDAPAPALEKHQAPVAASSETPVWLWWVGAAALLVIAAALVGLVIAQRRGSVAR